MNIQPDITAIIVNYKTPDYTNRAVKSIYESSPELRKEIIVIDNASGDDSIEKICQQWGDKIQLIENRENVGFGRANNQAMQIGKGRYFLLLNSDAEILEDGLSELVRTADQNPEIGLFGATVVAEDGSQQISCWKQYTVWYLFLRALYFYLILPSGWLGNINLNEYGKPQDDLDREVVSGCVMLYRKEVAEKVGFFDERFFMYCEDMDLCVRIWNAGYRVRFLAGPKVLHHGGGTSATMLNRMSIEQGRSTLQYVCKHSGLSAARLANLMLALFYVVRIPFWGIKSLFAQSQSRKNLKMYIVSLGWHLKKTFCLSDL